MRLCHNSNIFEFDCQRLSETSVRKFLPQNTRFPNEGHASIFFYFSASSLFLEHVRVTSSRQTFWRVLRCASSFSQRTVEACDGSAKAFPVGISPRFSCFLFRCKKSWETLCAWADSLLRRVLRLLELLFKSKLNLSTCLRDGNSSGQMNVNPACPPTVARLPCATC